MSANVTEKTLWMDVRGNHDYFNVPHSDSSLNYFSKYSVQGRKFRRSYMQQIVVGREKYTFIAVDASLEPGPKRQLHFVGMLSASDLRDLVKMNKDARASNSNYTILFGHYPTSCILSPGGEKGLREIIGSFEENYAYLCGHFHTQGGFIPRMYALHKNGFLELELGDWKKHRLFRVAAFDHGLFSFTDVRYNEWPIILVTNPKNALYNMPHKENISIQKNSKFIRILIFAPTKVENCRIKFDDHLENWVNCLQVSDVLHVVAWDPSKFKSGIHNIFIHVRTMDGNVKFIKHPFSLDGTRMNFDVLASIILTFDLTQIFQIIYGIALAGCIIPLCIFRIIFELVRCGKVQKPRIKSKILRNFVTNFGLLSSIDRLFVPLISYCIYISIGPWSFIEIVDGYMGVVFLWGYFVKGHFVPGTLTYIYGAFQLTFCQFPLHFIYAYEVKKRFNLLSDNKKPVDLSHRKKFCISMFAKFWRNFPFSLLILIEIILAFIVLWIHGFFAFILSPFRTWSVVYHVMLYYFAKNIPKKHFELISSVWL
ncbi:transmembrane protein 62-like isoform X2 [Condylostylus longicornis]|nr:transmembrane protein 62-like isoform X2 [Condylostylus longicornis]